MDISTSLAREPSVSPAFPLADTYIDDFLDGNSFTYIIAYTRFVNIGQGGCKDQHLRLLSRERATLPCGVCRT